MSPFRPTRRDLLHAGAVLPLGLGLPALLAAPSRRPKSCIFIYQYGGLSQLDSWDPKPDAPAELRGPYKPIADRRPRLPRRRADAAARRACADRYAVIRSMTHSVPVHDVANRMLLAGAVAAGGRRAVVRRRWWRSCKPTAAERAVLRLAPEVRRRGGAAGPDVPHRRLRSAPRTPRCSSARATTTTSPRPASASAPSTPTPHWRASRLRRAAANCSTRLDRRQPAAAGTARRRSTCSPARGAARRSTSSASRRGCATATAATRSGRTCCWPAG